MFGGKALTVPTSASLSYLPLPISPKGLGEKESAKRSGVGQLQKYSFVQSHSLDTSPNAGFAHSPPGPLPTDKSILPSGPHFREEASGE